MLNPLIAIVGSYSPTREKELGLRNLATAPQAGEQLGRELARQGFRIVVYSSLPGTLEIDVVRGYLSESAGEGKSIQVHYAQKNGRPVFAEEAANPGKLEFRPDYNQDWEFSFYQSLANVDGMLLVGGGPSALIAGLVTIGHRKPLIACAAFGGSAEKIRHALRTQNYPTTDEDLALMESWTGDPDQAGRLIGLLKKQRDEFARLEQVRLASEEKHLKARRDQELLENATINWHAVISTALFLLAAALWPLAYLIPDTKSTTVLLGVVLVAPMFAGASGASIRVVLDWAVGVTRTFELSTYNQYILLRYAALGVIAGGLAGVSFVLAQLFAGGTKMDTPEALTRLVPFLVIIGFAAGLAAEVVLSNLRKSPPVIEIPSAKLKAE